MSEPYDDYIEQEVVPKLKTVCAWHRKNFGCELVMHEASPGYENAGISHGICADCRNRTQRLRSAEPLEDALGQDLLQAYLEVAYANYVREEL